MGLEELTAAIESEYDELGAELTVELDRETRNELAVLEATLEPDETDELLRRALHVLFQSTVDTGRLDFHLRSRYDVTYDEYLSGVTYDEMAGTNQYPQLDDERRYQF